MDWRDPDEIQAEKTREEEIYLFKLSLVYARAAEIIDAGRLHHNVQKAVSEAVNLLEETERQLKTYEKPE